MTDHPPAAARNPAYAVAFVDWLACACAGVDERASRAVRRSGDDLLTDVAFAATAGHVHDFDDTFPEGVAHVSAVCAPAALVIAVSLNATIGEALAAYAEAFETMAAYTAASHPALYRGGWHPTAVWGSVGAAVAASRLFGLTDAEHEQAIRLAVLRAGGTRGAFGSDGKAIQVGLAAAHGVQAARLARGGARVDERAVRGELGFEGVFGARSDRAGPDPSTGTGSSAGGGPSPGPAIERNWIKLYPSCLGTHAPIEATLDALAADHDLTAGALEVTVHPVARQAAHLDRVTDPLEGKFSIPYCIALTIACGRPRLSDFATVDPEVRDDASRVTVSVDSTLPEFGAVLSHAGSECARVPCPTGSPERPVQSVDLARKVTDLAGGRLAGILDDLGAPAAEALTAARLKGSEAVQGR